MIQEKKKYALNPDYLFLARPQVKDVIAIKGTSLLQLKKTAAESIRIHAVNGSQLSPFSKAPENALNTVESMLAQSGMLVERTNELLEFSDAGPSPRVIDEGNFQFVDFIGITMHQEFVDEIHNWLSSHTELTAERFSIVISRSLTGLGVASYTQDLLQSGRKVSFFIVDPNRLMVGPVFPSDEISPEDLFQCAKYNERTTQLEAEELFVPIRHDTIREGLLNAMQSIADFIDQPDCSELRNSLINAYGPEKRHYVRRAHIQPSGAPLKATPLKLEGGVNGERQCTSKQFVEKYSFLISDITGVVTSLNRIETAEKSEPSFVYTAGHNWALRTDNPESIRRSLRGQSGGKGLTEIDAMAGAIAEAVERHSTIARGNEPMRRCKFADLPNAIHPNEIALFSRRQFADRMHLNATTSLYNHVPEPFDDSSLVSFVPIWSPSNGSTAWMLASQAYFMFPNAAALPGAMDSSGMRFARADSNGCAAGTTMADAAFQGICELIERDAVSIWWHNRIRRPEIVISSLNNEYIANVERWMKQRGRELWLLDLTNDINVPVVAAVSAIQTDKGTNKILLGFGSHTDVSRAASRAVSEVIQFQAGLPEEITGASLPESPTGSEAIDWYTFQTLSSNDFLLPEGRIDPTQYQQQKRYDVWKLISAVESVGTTVFLLDETRSDIGIPVVRCVAPGLRAWWKRLAPGRLYDVPVKLGWLDKPHAEEEMNPIDMFF